MSPNIVGITKQLMTLYEVTIGELKTRPDPLGDWTLHQLLASVRSGHLDSQVSMLFSLRVIYCIISYGQVN